MNIEANSGNVTYELSGSCVRNEQCAIKGMVLTDEQQFALPPKDISTSKHQEPQSVNTMKQPSTRRLFSYKLIKTACAGCKKSRKAQRHETAFRLAKKQQRKQTSRIRESNLITRNNEAAVITTAVFIQADKNGLRRL